MGIPNTYRVRLDSLTLAILDRVAENLVGRLIGETIFGDLVEVEDVRTLPGS